MMAQIICKEIDDYIEYARKHPKWINKDRKLLINNIVKPLLKRKDVYFDEEMFHLCIKFCEANYYPLLPFQKFIYAMVFFYTDETKRFAYFRKHVILEGRGNGKDGFIVPLANFLMTPIYGVKKYNVEIVANAEEQSRDTFNVCWDMLESHKSKFKGKFSWTKELITNNATESFMRFNTSAAGTKDGKKCGLLIMNELHGYQDYSQINVFESALGKIQAPREFIITTQGYVRDGPLDDQLTLCEEILRTGENPLRIFPFLCRLDDEKEANDEEAWHKANPSLEYFPILAEEVRMNYMEAKRLPSKWPEFMTKRMNMPAAKNEATITTWENILKCCYDDVKKKTPRYTQDTTGQPAIVGLDYADIRDFASVGILTETDEGEFIWRQHTWVNKRSPKFESIKFPLANYGLPEFEDFEIVDAPVIPVDEIVSYVTNNYLKNYDVRKIAMDTYRYTLFKQAFINEGLTIEEKGNPQGMVRLIRKLGAATGVIAPFIEQAFANGKVNYGPSAIMRWYTNNVAVITDKFGNKQFGKIEPELRKTDGFMAFDVAMYCKDELEIPTFYI